MREHSKIPLAKTLNENMSLSMDELSSLLSLFKTPPKVLSMEQLESSFKSKFRTTSQQLNSCNAIAILLSDKILNSRAQILLSYWLLARSFQPVAENPFLQFILDFIQSGAHELPKDRAFIGKLLVAKISQERDAAGENEIARKSIAEIIEMLDSQRTETLLPPDTLKKLGAMSSLKCSEVPSLGLANYGIRPVILHQQSNLQTTDPIDLKLAEQSLQLGNSEQGFHNYLRPVFSRCTPPIYGAEEFRWICPLEAPLLIYDASASSGESMLKELRDILRTAHSAALSPAQFQTVLMILETDPSAISSVDLNPTNLPGIVEHNPNLASELLVKLLVDCPPVYDRSLDGSMMMDTGNKTAMLLNALSTMDMSLHSMEVMNHLATFCSPTEGIPLEFIKTYVSTCIVYCENVKDKYLQNRLVRLLCVFLQSLIRSRILHPAEEILLQIQSFCVEFSKIREANGLFKLLKSLEQASSNSVGSTDAATGNS